MYLALEGGRSWQQRSKERFGAETKCKCRHGRQYLVSVPSHLRLTSTTRVWKLVGGALWLIIELEGVIVELMDGLIVVAMMGALVGRFVGTMVGALVGALV